MVYHPYSHPLLSLTHTGFRRFDNLEMRQTFAFERHLRIMQMLEEEEKLSRHTNYALSSEFSCEEY